MKKSKLLPVLGIVLGLAMALSAVPVLAASVTVSVSAPAQVPCAGSFTASVDITEVEVFAAAEFVVNFDSSVITVTGVTDGLIGGNIIHVDGYTTPWEGDPNKMKVLVSWPPLYPGVSGAGYLCEIQFDVIGTEGDTSPINLTDGLLANQDMQDGLPIEADWLGTTVTVGPCFAPVLVSLVGPPPVEADMEASDSAPPEPPPGFEPRDEFVPCEWVYVWGYGFEPGQSYEIYIQPYEEGVSVAPGQPLDHALSAALGYPAAGPPGIIVPVAADGTIGPVPLFHASEEHICMYWEIVADKVNPDGDTDVATNPGVYDPNEDALDAVALGEYGFHVFPEALTIMLFGVGLASLSGYVLVRRRKSADMPH
jgi:hypothetical protein